MPDHPFDLCDIDADWTPDQQTLIRRVRDFVDASVLPVAARHHEEGTFPTAWLEGIGKLGILDYFADPNGDPVAYGLAMRELERGGSPLRSAVSVQGALVMTALARYGSPEQKRRWLANLATFDSVGCFAMTEPETGSNPAAMRTTIERKDNGLVLHGQKRWATNATIAQVAVVWARYGDNIVGALVEKGRPGVLVKPLHGKWSFRASESSEIVFDKVRITEENLLPGATSLGKALACLNEARYGIVWGVCGAARACLEETMAYLSARTQFGAKPITGHQLVQEKLAWMSADLAGMELLAKRLGEMKARNALTPALVSLGKMNNCRKALEIARTCRELLGANGILTRHHVGRRMVDLETVITYEGTEQIHALSVGRHLTGISAFE